MNPLDELFMAETMTTRLLKFEEQSEDRSFVGVYEAGEQILPEANKYTYDEISFSRGMAPVTGPDSPSKARRPLGMKVRAGRVFAVKAHVDLPANLVMMARGAGQTMSDPEGWLNNNLKNLFNEIQRTRNYIAAQSLHAATVDLAAVPNADIDGAWVLNFPVATMNAGASWGLAATKIRSALINPLKRTYKRNVGFKPGIALASDTVEDYITGNSELSNPIDNSPTLAQRKIETSYLEGGTVIRLGGIDFNFVRDDYVTDANQESADAADGLATVSDVLADPDLVSVLPPRARWQECFAQVQGRVFVPTGPISAAVGSVNGGSGPSPFQLLSEQRGWAVWLELIMNPVGVRLHAAWHGDFVQKYQGAVMVYNTTP